MAFCGRLACLGPMARDSPTYDRSAKERGLYAGHGDDPTLASYLSSALYLLSVPGFILLAYTGYWTGYWSYGSILPVFAALLVATLAITVALMHVRTGR